jgi:hypothetical protein
VLAAVELGSSRVVTTNLPEGPNQEQVQAAAQAYLYGYPLVYGLNEIAAYIAGGGRFPMQAQLNEFGHARRLAGPEFEFVSPNNDTVYSIAMCDLSQGPLVLHVPDAGGRYYVMECIDAWSNNFAYPGRRATGTAEAEFLLAPSGYDGELPAEMRVIHSPTDVLVFAGRIQVDGEADLPSVNALQDRFTLTPLSVYNGGAALGPLVGLPQPDDRVGEGLEWWEHFRVTLAAFPPPKADAPFISVCEKLGLTSPDSPMSISIKTGRRS